MIDPPPSGSRPRSSRCWTLCSVDGPVDVQVVAADDERLGAVLPRLAAAVGVAVPGLWSGSSRLADDLPLTAPELAHGAQLGLGRPGPRTRVDERSSALELHVVGGPEAGRTEPLGRGRHVLGRGAEAGVRLDDPDVSRRHASLDIDGGPLTVTDLGSTNGTRLDDDAVGRSPRPWPAGTLLRLGASTLAVRGPDGGPAALEPAPGGRIRLRSAPRLTIPHPQVDIEFPRPPAPPPRRRLAWLAIALPAVGGVAMAAFLRMPQFLFFGLLSPVVAVGTWLSERWSGRRDGRRDAAAHAIALLDAEARLAAAVRAAGRSAEAATPDLATLTSAARRRSGRLWERRRTDADALLLRVGTGPGPTGVTRSHPDGSRVPECAPDLPAVVDLRTSGGLAVVGPRGRTTGALAAAVVQLVALHAPGEMELVVLADGERLADWAWLRWLPQLRAAVGRSRGGGAGDALRRWLAGELAFRRNLLGRVADGEGRARPPWLVVLVDGPADPRVGADLAAAGSLGVCVLTAAESAEQLPVTVGAVLQLTGETGDTATLRRVGQPDQYPVVVDRVPPATAAAFARDLAALLPAGSATSLPRQVRLLDLPPTGLGLHPDGSPTGSWSRARDSLVATLGRSVEGPFRVDLCRAGPHALVAGTTGAGKSELLQTLIAGLALHHPPDRCSFLLVDYKGGAAFAEAVALPHTVGLVTDLDGRSTERALRSLGAELARREALLAAWQVADVAALPDDVALARLVIVVDEFATLAEELPAFVPGLVGIAQRGRSLGVHLVLATQRPGGVVSPEIRANCSLRICLRTTDDGDSRDLLGTGLAAHIPVDLPGRGYVRTGTATPVEIQAGRVATTPPAGDAGPDVRRSSWPDPEPQSVGGTADGDTDLARVVRALREHTARTGVARPHRPWHPPLPRSLEAAELDGAAPTRLPASRGRLRIGLLDRPDEQRQEPLELDLERAGGWLAVGGARSGRTTLLRTVLAEAVARLTAEELHVHVLDHGGSLTAAAAGLAHTGTAVGADDPLRTARLVDRLGEEVAARRSGGRTGEAPALLLLVDGVESVSAQLDEADPGRGSAALLRLVRDGAAAGLTCVLTADRAVPGGRLAAVADNRLVLPLPDRADYAVAGIPARAVPEERPPGRALLGEAALECQLALPRPLPTAPAGPPGVGLLRIAELPPDPEVALPRRGPGAVAAPSAFEVPVGPGGDEGRMLSVDLRRTGGLLVVGPPGSGKSSALDAIALHLGRAGVPVLHLGMGAAPAERGVGARAGARLDAGDPAAVSRLAAWLADRGPAPGVVVVDDVGRLADSTLLAALPEPDGAAGVVVVGAGGAAELARCYQGPVAALRRTRTGLLLCPAPGDAEVLGIRLPRTAAPHRPGSGWLALSGTVERVQVARRRVGR